MSGKWSLCLKVINISFFLLLVAFFWGGVRTCNATVYLDNAATGCSDGSSTYSPDTRSCGGGNDKVYTTLASFNSGIVAGATNYIRSGIYLRDSGEINIGSLHITKSGSSGSPTIIKAYPGEERAAIIGTAKRGTTYNSNPGDSTGTGSWLYYPNPAVIVWAASYVQIDGIKTYGQVYFVGGHDLALLNSDIGGGGNQGYQGNTLRLNTVYNTIIKNNLIHDNCRRVESDDGSLFIGYAFSATFDGNTFYNGYGNDLENKDSGGQSGRTTEIKNNFFVHSTIGSSSSSYDTAIRGMIQNVQVSNVLIHHNIFLNKQIGYHVFANPSNTHVVYNNTFINCGTDIRNPASGGPYPVSVYNNIFYHENSGKSFINLYALNYLQGSNYNIYYNSATWFAPFNITAATTLSTWKTTSGKDAASISTNPDFFNASGSTPESFKRSSYTESFTGYQGITRAGAYVTGNETIGFTTSSGVGSPSSSSLSIQSYSPN